MRLSSGRSEEKHPSAVSSAPQLSYKAIPMAGTSVGVTALLKYTLMTIPSGGRTSGVVNTYHVSSVYHEPEQTVVGVVEAVAPLESPFVNTAVASLSEYATKAALAQSSFAG